MFQHPNSDPIRVQVVSGGGSPAGLTNAELRAAPLTVVAGAPSAVTGAIASGQALSAAIVIDGKASALQIPAAWTAAAITFQGSIDGTTFGDIYDGATERTFASAQVVAGRMLALNMADWLGFKAIRIRSGTAASPVNQAAARTLTVGLAG